jgi:hypothetical protein
LILLNSYGILLWVSVFDMTEAQAIVMAEAKTSMFKDDDMPKSITSKKLNGLNYLAWAHAVKIFLQGKRMLKYLTDNPPNKKDPTYEDWMSGDSVVMGWLWHSMKPHVSTAVEFCDSSKKI